MFGYHMEDDPALVSHRLSREETVLAVPEPMAAECLSPEEIRGFKEEGIVSLRPFSGCPFVRMDADTWMGEQFDRYCREDGFDPKIFVISQSVLTVLGRRAEGIGATLVPAGYLDHLTAEQRRGMVFFRWRYPDVTLLGAVLRSEEQLHHKGSHGLCEVFTENMRRRGISLEWILLVVPCDKNVVC